MIALQSVTKEFNGRNGPHTVIDQVSATFEPDRHYVVFGQPGAGKSTLLKLMSGLQWPTTGHISRRGTVGPPLGSMAILGFGNTVRSVVTFCANLYEMPAGELLDFVIDFGELDNHVDTPVPMLPALERVALSYAVGYGIPADYYLIDGSPVGGRDGVRQRCLQAFAARRETASTVLAVSNLQSFKPQGETAVILHHGQLTPYRHLQEAIDVYSSMEIESRQGTLSAADFMTRQGDLTGAVDYLEDYVAANADDLAGHKMLASVALRSQNFAAAKEALQAVVDMTPEDKDSYLALARTAERDEDWATAASALTEYLKSEPGNVVLYASLARYYDKLGDPKSAARVWYRIFAASDNLADCTAAIRACVRLQDWNAAFRMLDHALEQWPSDITLLTMASRICLQLERPDDFIDTLVRMAKVDLDGAVTRASGALAQLKWENVVDFLDGVRAAGMLDRVNPDAMKRLVMYLSRAAKIADKDGRTEEAERIRGRMLPLPLMV